MKKQFSKNSRSTVVPGIVAIGLISILMAIILGLPSPSWAAPPGLPPRPDPGLPPRPGPEMPPKQGPTSPGKRTSSPAGAYITLDRPTTLNPNFWTVVQWQDDLGNWHNVDEWQGTFEANQKTWWVDAKDFSTGPFRWVVYQTPGGAVLAQSDPFYLPSAAFETVFVKISP